MKIYKKFFLAALVVAEGFFITSCSINTSADNETENWIGKKIQFPGSLKLITDDTLVSINVFKERVKNKNIIVSIIDVGCSKCIYNELNSLDSLFNNANLDSTKFNIAFVLNINESDSASFMIDLKYLITSSEYLIWDNNHAFETENDIITRNKSKRTFLIDQNKNIILVGNPLFKNHLKDIYYNKLSN